MREVCGGDFDIDIRYWDLWSNCLHGCRRRPGREARKTRILLAHPWIPGRRNRGTRTNTAASASYCRWTSAHLWDSGTDVGVGRPFLLSRMPRATIDLDISVFVPAENHAEALAALPPR